MNTNLQKAITIVSGLPRSGTSMMMKMLEAGGLPPLTDDIRQADRDNPNGYYEFERVKALPDGDTDWLASSFGKAIKVITPHLVYLPGEYSYQVIIMTRNMAEILASQREMMLRRGEDPDKISNKEMAAHFETNIRSVDDWASKQDNIKTMRVNYNQMVKEPKPVIQEIDIFLGGNLTTAHMAEIVDRSLYRQVEGSRVQTHSNPVTY